MGSFKEKGHEGVREMREHAGEASDIGEKMTEQADEIRKVLDSINLQDEEDMEAVSDTSGQYQDSFDAAFSEQVETAGEEIRQEGERLGETIRDETENVKDGIGKLEQAGGISEIGREAADAGKARLEESRTEYESIADEAKETVDETQRTIDRMKGDLGSIFG